MEGELGILRGNVSQRNVVTSYDQYSYDPSQDLRSVLRSYSVQPGVYKEYGTIGFESFINLCKPTSPVAPATSPSLQVLPSITPVPKTPEPRVCWKGFTTQLNGEGNKSRFSVRSVFDDVRVLEHKYNRYSKQKAPLQVLRPTHAPAPSPTKYTSSPTRPHHLKPLDSHKRHKKKKRKKSANLNLDVSGNGLVCPVSDPPSNKDYTPGFVKITNHDCYRCVNRMSAHDHHSWIQAFNDACRIRRPSKKRSPKAAGEHLLCVQGSKDKIITDEEVSTEAHGQIVPRSQSVNLLHNNLDDNSAPDNTSGNRTSKPIAKKLASLIKPGKISERHRNNQGDPKYLTSIMLTTPINTEFLKNLELNNLTHSLKGAQSFTMAIEYHRKNRKRVTERKLKEQQKSEDLAIASSFTMLTQTEGLSSFHEEQEQLREFSYSVMEDANTLYRPDSILSISDGHISNRLPVLVFSATDLRETNKDLHLNKNASANTGIDPCTNSKGTDGPDDPKSESKANSLEDPCASSKEQQENSATKSNDDDSSCYWVSTSEMVHSINGLLESGAHQLSQNLPKCIRDVSQISENRPNTSEDFREDEDPYFEEDDDEEEEEEVYYDLQTFPRELNIENFALPTGRHLCYTAMTDKRYNKWSRQKRKGTSNKKKSKKRDKEDKHAATDESLSATQQAYLKNLEAMYRNREGTLKYNHDIAKEMLAPNNVGTSLPDCGPTSCLADAASSRVSLPNSNSSSRVQTVPSTSSTQCATQVRSLDGISDIQPPHYLNSDTCEASCSFADGVEDELKMLCTSSNSDQCMPTNEKWDTHNHSLKVRSGDSRSLNVDALKNPELRSSMDMTFSSRRSASSRRGNSRGSKLVDHVPRKTSSLLTIPSNYKDNLKERPGVSKDHGVEFPELVKPVTAQTAGHQERSVPSHTYIASIQRQILNYHRRELCNGSSLICPLYVTLPTMNIRKPGKGQTGMVRSAPVKPTRSLDHRKKSPRFRQRNYTVVRNPDDPANTFGKGKKYHGTTTRRPKPKTYKRRALMGEEMEAITIHDLLRNLNSSDPNCFKTKKHPSNKSPSRGQTFREIYGKITCPTGNHRNKPDKLEQERSLSQLSISKSVTFSVLPLSDFYKIPERFK